MFLLVWPAVLFAVRISANTGPCFSQKKEQTATLTCTGPAHEKPWLCTNGHNETHSGGNNVEHNRISTVTINLSAERNGTNVTCRVNLTGTIPTEKPVTLNLTSDLQNCTGYDTQPTNNCTKPNWRDEPMTRLLETVKQLEVIAAFLIGFLLATLVSTVVCCLMRKSHRKKLKTYRNLSDALEMTNDPGPGASAAGNSDVDYSTIKFSAKRAKKLDDPQETTETEYAEIKREETVQEEDGEGSQEEVAITGEVEVEAEIGGMMEDEGAALCPDVEVVVSEMEACSV